MRDNQFGIDPKINLSDQSQAILSAVKDQMNSLRYEMMMNIKEEIYRAVHPFESLLTEVEEIKQKLSSIRGDRSCHKLEGAKAKIEGIKREISVDKPNPLYAKIEESPKMLNDQERRQLSQREQQAFETLRRNLAEIKRVRIEGQKVEYSNDGMLGKYHKLDHFPAFFQSAKQCFFNLEFPVLQQIDIRGSSNPNEDCRYLMEGSFPSLSHLYLTNNYIGELGCQYLAKSNFPKLSILSLNDNHIGDQGIRHLSKGDFPKLFNLCLKNNPIQRKQDMKQLLNKAFPKLSHIVM